MARRLSPREDQIVDRSVEGLTNDAIANQMGLSIGTINTYWTRIKLKVGGFGRTDTVAKVLKDRSDRKLREANVERQQLTDLIAEREKGEFARRAARELLHTVADQITSTVWATDRDLNIHIIENGEAPSAQFGVKWEAGKTVYEIFNTSDAAHPAIAAHNLALAGTASEVRLPDEPSQMSLHVIPLLDESKTITGCISTLDRGE